MDINRRRIYIYIAGLFISIICSIVALSLKPVVDTRENHEYARARERWESKYKTLQKRLTALTESVKVYRNTDESEDQSIDTLATSNAIRANQKLLLHELNQIYESTIELIVELGDRPPASHFRQMDNNLLKETVTTSVQLLDLINTVKLIDESGNLDKYLDASTVSFPTPRKSFGMVWDVRDEQSSGVVWKDVILNLTLSPIIFLYCPFQIIAVALLFLKQPAYENSYYSSTCSSISESLIALTSRAIFWSLSIVLGGLIGIAWAYCANRAATESEISWLIVLPPIIVYPMLVSITNLSIRDDDEFVGEIAYPSALLLGTLSFAAVYCYSFLSNGFGYAV